ncbi:hypothetical protein AAFN88_11690 [Pelagibius sp. CAU 1746]|uniref:hypothetical protein n=1 Tax=Pelagibius sp. CAU 1746 TaxID=3140370 RepID=UPI00325B5ADF
MALAAKPREDRMRPLTTIILSLILSVAAGAGTAFVVGDLRGAPDAAEIANSSELKDGDLSLVRMGAESRAILTKRFGDTTLVCAEPAPDVGLAAQRTAQFMARGGGKNSAAGEADAELELNSNQIDNMQRLLRRTQGLQNLRDILFRACEAYINGAIYRETYASIYTQAVETTSVIMGIELIAGSSLPPEQTEVLVRALIDRGSLD